MTGAQRGITDAEWDAAARAVHRLNEEHQNTRWDDLPRTVREWFEDVAWSVLDRARKARND